MRTHAAGAASALPAARTSAALGRRGRPETANASNSYPYSGTSRASTRSGDPAKVTRPPRCRSASATASAGATCPTVPPAAIRNRSCRSSAITGDVKEDADRTEHHHEARAAVGDERERDSGQRRNADRGGHVDRGLPTDERRDPGCEPFCEGVAAGDREPHARVRERAERHQHERDPDEAELL